MMYTLENVETLLIIIMTFFISQHQMEEKQRRLREALAKQQEYQNALAQVNIRLDNAETSLEDPAMEQSLPEQIDNIKVSGIHLLVLDLAVFHRKGKF